MMDALGTALGLAIFVLVASLAIGGMLSPLAIVLLVMCGITVAYMFATSH